MKYILNKYFLIVLGVFLFIYLSLKLIVPSFLRKELVTSLNRYTSMIVSLKDVEFEPIGLSLVLRDLKIGPTLRVGEIQTSVSLYGLLSKEIIVSRFSLIDANVQLDKDFKVAGVKVIENKVNDKKDEERPATSKDWKLTINESQVEQVKVTLLNEDILLIKNLKILNLKSYETSTPVRVNGLFNFNKTQLSIAGNVNNYISLPTYEIKIKLKELSLSTLSGVFPQLGTIKGYLNLDSNIKGKGKDIKAIVNLGAHELTVYSLDKSTVDYYLKDLKVDNLSINLHKEITIKADKIETNNLILGTKTKSHENRKYLSKFANIKLTEFLFKKNGIPFDLQANYNKTGKIKVSQTITKGKKTLKVKITAVDLVPLSETFEETLSYQVESGKLNLELTTHTLNKLVNGRVLVKFDQFRLDDRNEKNQKLESKPGFPLSTAISIIRNDEGSIEVELPISGSEKDPEFGFLPLLKKGVASIIMPKLGAMIASKAALRFIPMLLSSVPFSPANTFILVKGSYQLLTKPRFKDIEFLPMKDEVKEKSKTHLNKLATFLKNNKKVSFNLCPEVSVYEARDRETDKALDKEVVLELAKKRMAKVTEYLSEMSVSSEQTIFCRPKTSEKSQKFGVIIISL